LYEGILLIHPGRGKRQKKYYQRKINKLEQIIDDSDNIKTSNENRKIEPKKK
jgi:hypothetical protein